MTRKDTEVAKVDEAPERGGSWIFDQSEFLRAQLTRALRLLFVISAVAVLSLALNLVQFDTSDAVRTIGLTPDLRVVELSPSDQPLINESGLADWAAGTVRQALSLSFVRYADELNAVSARFSQEGFNSYITALKGSGTLDALTRRRLVLSVVQRAAPSVVNSGVLDGVYTWRVKVPITLSYQNSEGVVATQQLSALVLIQRMDQREHPQGVGVVQFVLNPAAGE